MLPCGTPPEGLHPGPHPRSAGPRPSARCRVHGAWLLAAWAASEGAPALDLDPVVLGRWPAALPCVVGASSVQSNHVYVGTVLAGVRVVDISEPTHPRPVGTLATVGQATQVAVSGNLAVVMDGGNGVLCVDVSLPSAPRLLGTHPTSQRFTQIVLAGHYAYLAEGGSEPQDITVLDVADPASPHRVNPVGSMTGVGIAVAGTRGYVPAGFHDFRVFDLEDPAAPRLSRTLTDLDTLPHANYSPVVIVHDDRLFVTDRELSFGRREIPETGFVFRKNWDFRPAGAKLGVVSSSHAYLAWGPKLQILDLRDVTSQRLVGRFTLDSNCLGLALDGNSLCVGDETGLTLYDTRSPSIVQREKEYRRYEADVDSIANDVAVAGHSAYVAFGTGVDATTLLVRDVTDPVNAPITGLASTVTGAGLTRVAADSRVVLAVDGGKQLNLYSVNPTSGPVLAEATYGQGLEDVALVGAHAVTAGGDAGVSLLDVSDPSHPVLVGRTYTAGTARGVAGWGHRYLAVADGDAGLTVVDLVDPTNPIRIGNTRLVGGSATSVTVAGDRAFVASGSSGVYVISLADPAHPRPLTRIATRGSATDIALDLRFAYVAEGEEGIEAFSLAPGGEVQRVGANMAFDALGIVAAGDRLYVASRERGLIVLRQQAPALSVSGALTTDGFVVTVKGPSRQTIQLQRSADLVRWDDWRPVVLDSAGAGAASDAEVASGGTRYFRARQ